MLKRVLRWLVPYWRRSRGIMVLVFSLTVFAIATRTLYPVIFKFIIDHLSGDFDPKSAKHWILVLFGVGLLREVTQAFLPSSRAWLNMTNSLHIRMGHFGTVLRKRHDFYNRFRMGDLVTRLTDDIDQFEKIGWYSGSGVFRPIEAILTLVFSLGVMFTLDWRLTLASTLPLPFIVWGLARTETIQQRRYEERQKRTSETVESLESIFSGARIVKGYVMESAQEEIFDKVLEKRERAETRVITLQAALEGIFSLLNQTGLIIVLFLGGYFVVVNPEFTLGDFYAFVAYLSGLTMPLWTIAWFFVSTNVTNTSVGRLEELEKEAERKPGVLEIPQRHPPLHIRNLCFEYEPEKLILDQISFKVRAGETVALVGPVACGKTTLLGCIMGMMKPISGSIELGGRDLFELSDEERARHLAYAPQEPVLFSGNVGENVTLGRETVSLDQVERSMATASLGGEVGLDREVGQSGRGLSGGQRGRVSLARALAGAPSILVLDDVTSALDAKTEKRFWDSVRSLLPDAGILVSTHREAAALRADRVLWLTEGRILHEGRHEELLAEHRGYQRLFAMEEG
jgi:ATP-binding cassette, subfamily B, multidrug efflux pump